MRNILTFLLIVVFTKEHYGQSLDSSLSRKYTQAARFNVLNLLDILDGNLSVGGEYAFKPRLSVTTDLSFVFYSLYYQNKKWALGYIIKPAIRYYLSDSRRGFIEAAVFYKRVGYKTEDWLNMEVVNGLPTFQQFQEFTLRKRVLGTNFQTGLQRNISKDKLLRIEGYIGLGIRFKWQDIKGKPNAVLRRDNVLFSQANNDYYILPGIPMGLRLVYCIK